MQEALRFMNSVCPQITFNVSARRAGKWSQPNKERQANFWSLYSKRNVSTYSYRKHHYIQTLTCSRKLEKWLTFWQFAVLFHPTLLGCMEGGVVTQFPNALLKSLNKWDIKKENNKPLPPACIIWPPVASPFKNNTQRNSVISNRQR